MTIMEHERPYERVKTLPALEKQTLKDFYFTFKFSQNNGSVQKDIHDAIALSYSKNDIAYILEHEERLSLQASYLKTPQPHPWFDPDDISWEFYGQWVSFRQSLEKRSVLPEERSVVDSLIIPAAVGIIKQDLLYMDQGRRYNTEDRWQSFIKTYALDGRDTTSSSFNTLFKEINVLCQDARNRGPHYKNVVFNELKNSADPLVENFEESLHTLQNLWEEKHPSESFYP